MKKEHITITLLSTCCMLLIITLIGNYIVAEAEKRRVYATGVLFGMMDAYHQTSNDPILKLYYLEVGAKNSMYGYRVENGQFKLPALDEEK